MSATSRYHNQAIKRRRLAIRLVLGVALSGLFVMPTWSLPGLDRSPILRPSLPDNNAKLRQELVPSPERAVAIAERRYQGRAVGARHLGNGVYRVRILQDNGKVKTVTIRPE